MTKLPFLFLLAYLASLVVGAAPTFCKCTCFTNSTIIKLGPHQDTPPPPGAESSSSPASSLSSADAASTAPASTPRALTPRAASASCTQCNRKFCLDYNLPICKGAEEKDVLTSCFQRDSRKDQLIVWSFILGTAGLLGWAGVRRLLEMRSAKPLAFGPGGTAAAARSPGLRSAPAGGGSYTPLSPADVNDGVGRGLR